MKIASISWKILRLMLKVFIAALMAFCVAAGVMSAIGLYTQQLYRSQPITALETLVDRAALTGDRGEVAAWLSARPLAEMPADLKILIPESATLAPQSFFTVSQRELKLGHPKEALFWLELGRYRLLYDLLRCGGKPKEARMLNQMLNAMMSAQIQALIRAHPESVDQALQRVLDFDVKYPAADEPSHVCDLAVSKARLVDPMDWPQYHRALWRMTERHIRETEKKRQAKKQPEKKPVPEKSAKRDKQEKRAKEKTEAKEKTKSGGAAPPVKK